MRPVIHKTRNRFETTLTTVAATETQMPLVEVVEAPANRGTQIPVGSILRSLVVSIQPTAFVANRHQNLLVYRPASENIGTPIASYLDSADPLGEEGVKMRRLPLGKLHSYAHTGAETSQLPRYTFRWKGAKRMYESDDVSLWFLDTSVTSYIAQIWLTFTQ